MAFIQAHFSSETLMRTVTINVILPADRAPEPGTPQRGDRPFKTLYLLHGVGGNYTDWVNGTRIQRFADEHDLAVVMPSGDNSFYVDRPDTGNYYGEFVGRELVEKTRKMFPLSHKREDTFIGGLSMGGFGAMRNGLKYHDTFGYITSFSGAFYLENMVSDEDDFPIFTGEEKFVEGIFGDLDNWAESDNNPRYLIQKLLAEGVELPGIYMACGDQDMFLANNVDFVEFLTEKGIEVTFEIGQGDHDWDFWDTYVKRAIEWLPTEK